MKSRRPLKVTVPVIVLLIAALFPAWIMQPEVFAANALPEKPADAYAKAYEETEREQEICSYLQVPESMSKDHVWSGDWTYIEAGGQQFFYFGCGICCLSNMYSTFLKEAYTPDIMFEKAREDTDYYPESGVGALSWAQMAAMARGCGAEVEIKRKPKEYSTFKEDAAAADTMVVLVCRDNDDTLWFYTKGHYVNIWEYDSDTGTVFVTDSSGLYNRKRVYLQDIYNALKTSSDAQYMIVNADAPQD